MRKRPRITSYPDVLTIPEAARVLRLSRNSAYEAARRGDIPTVRIGRSLRVPKAALLRLLDGSDEE
jgi:excisionase family DNA binding protein